MKSLLLTFFSLLTLAGIGQSKTDISEVKEAMQKQEIAWNKADVEGFMAYYWKSDSLKFIGSKGITYGWQKTLDNYKKNYPNADAMGVLTFENNTIEQLSPNKIFVIGKWSLKRKEGDVGGHYTLLWKKLNGKWVIVVDHTS
ncbi:MAG: nuclear transport factor 2 family protein [Sphingobacteriaceae bacterium]|nr:nuclear transport factor 2 family protein [Sphingobacteriaceae bacterium]